MSEYEGKIFACQRPQGMSGKAHGWIRLGKGGQKSIAQILWNLEALSLKICIEITFKLMKQD